MNLAALSMKQDECLCVCRRSCSSQRTSRESPLRRKRWPVPSVGVYLIIEQGNATPASLIDVAGVAGVWWYIGNKAPAPYDTDARNLQISYCYLDKDPVEVAQALKPAMLSRWKSEGITGLLAAPFYCIVPYEWERHLP